MRSECRRVSRVMRTGPPMVTSAVSVIFISRKWPPAIGGMETYSLRLTQSLSETVDLDVITLPGHVDGTPPSSSQLLLFPFRVIAAFFGRQTRPDVVHVGDLAIWPLGWLASVYFRSPTIVISAHGTDVSYWRRRTIRGNLYGLYLRLGARLLRNARVIANSSATHNVLKQSGWTTEKIVRLATDMKRGPAVKGTRRTLLFCGRVLKMKGCAWFVDEVLPLLPDDIRLRIAGTIWEETDAHVLDHPRVDFLGHLDKNRLAQAYRDAMCVIAPNIEVHTGEYEGFGLVATEAAAAGGVILAADRDGLIDAVVDGVTGFLVESGNPDAWASKILEVSNWTDEHRAIFIERASLTAAREYSWDRVAGETLEVYRNAMAEG